MVSALELKLTKLLTGYLCNGEPLPYKVLKQLMSLFMYTFPQSGLMYTTLCSVFAIIGIFSLCFATSTILVLLHCPLYHWMGVIVRMGMFTQRPFE